MTTPRPGVRFWPRNVLFAAVCLAGAGAVGSTLLRPERTVLSEAPAPVLGDLPARIDAEFEAAWKTAGLEPAPRAPDLILMRRLSLALTGTIPSLQEIRAFEQLPPGGRLASWLTHLLEDRRSSDYLAERLARATVGVEGGPFLIYRRRRFVSWLSDQLSLNRPYDEVVRALIASRGLWTNDPETNFITVTVDQNQEGRGPDEVKLASRVTRAFLGVRIDCVQCHNDHLGGSWEQRDFHQLASFFAGAEMSFSGVRDTGEPYTFKFKGQTAPESVPLRVPFRHELLPEAGAPRERLAAWVTHPQNPAFARATVNRVWGLLTGRPLVEPVDEIPLQGPLLPGLQALADDFVAHGYDLRRLIRAIASTRAFAADSLAPTEAHERHWAAFPLTRLRPEQVAGSLLQAASLTTIDAETHIVFRLARALQESEFIERYGDAGEDEFAPSAGTIPQRLLLMNGELVQERIGGNPLLNAATQIAATAPDDPAAVEAAYLAVLSRRPTPEEAEAFVAALRRADDRGGMIEDLTWALINGTEFSWNH